MQDARSLIHQAHTENWEELDRSGMNLMELLPEIAEELGALVNLQVIDLSGNPHVSLFGWMSIDEYPDFSMPKLRSL